jgi:hypothetical protein
VAILVKFSVSGAEKYEEVLRRLEKAGGAIPPGQLYHVSYGSRENLQVIDVFDSQESLDAFGKTLLPIIGEMEITALPEIHEVYKIMKT